VLESSLVPADSSSSAVAMMDMVSSDLTLDMARGLAAATWILTEWKVCFFGDGLGTVSSNLNAFVSRRGPSSAWFLVVKSLVKVEVPLVTASSEDSEEGGLGVDSRAPMDGEVRVFGGRFSSLLVCLAAVLEGGGQCYCEGPGLSVRVRLRKSAIATRQNRDAVRPVRYVR